MFPELNSWWKERGRALLGLSGLKPGATSTNLTAEEAHQVGGWQVGGEEARDGAAGGAGEGFGGEIAAADGAFHGGGPAGGGPVSGEKNAGPCGGGRGAVGVDAGARGIGGVEFLDDRGFHEIGSAGGGEEFADFGESEVDDFGAGFVDEGFGGADDELDVAAGRLRILSPLRGYRFIVVVGPTACAVGCILAPSAACAADVGIGSPPPRVGLPVVRMGWRRDLWNIH